MNRTRRWRRGLTIGVAVVTTLAGGIAYATIPDAGGVYSACMLKGVGTIRLIDKSLPSTYLLSRCTDREMEIFWNQTGPPGAQGVQGVPGKDGANGKNGTDGQDGVSVSTAAEPAGTNCAAGGVQLTAANGIGYVCNGAKGPMGDQGPAGPAGGAAVAFAETVVLNGDPNVRVFDDSSLGTITVGCLPVGGTLYPQVEYTNTTSTAKAVDLLTGNLSHPKRVAPGDSAFLREDGRSVIGPDSIPGSTRAGAPNTIAAHSPFAIVEVVSRLPYPVTFPGIDGSAAGCGYLLTVTRSTE